MGVSASAPKGYLIAFIKVKDKEKFAASAAGVDTIGARSRRSIAPWASDRRARPRIALRPRRFPRYPPTAARRFGAAAKTAIGEYGGTILAKGPGDLVETANGGAEGSAAILLEFESLAQAKEFYYSESYQKAKEIRDDGGADVSVMFVEGVPPKFTGLMM